MTERIPILHADNHQEVRIRKPNGSVIYIDGNYPGLGNQFPKINEIVEKRELELTNTMAVFTMVVIFVIEIIDTPYYLDLMD